MRRASLHKITEAIPSRLLANPSGALRLRLVLAMIAAYLAMMAFLIYSARHVTKSAVAASDFSPAMIALASCMTFSIYLTGLFVFVRRGD